MRNFFEKYRIFRKIYLHLLKSPDIIRCTNPSSEYLTFQPACQNRAHKTHACVSCDSMAGLYLLLFSF